MAAFNEEMVDGGDFDDSVDFPYGQGPPLSPHPPNSRSASLHPSTVQLGNLAGSYDQEDSFLDPFLLDRVQECSNFTVASQPTTFYDDFIFEKIFSDAGTQPLPAPGLEPPFSSQPFRIPDHSPMTFEMGDLIQEHQNLVQQHQDNPQTTEATPSDDKVAQRCDFLGCREQQLFSTKAALRGHQDKHLRPYVCHNVLCNRRAFGNKGGLERHKREVHGCQVYKCPILSCTRNKKGFHRRYNLFEHQKRAHGAQPSSFPRSSANAAVDEGSETEGRSPTSQRDSVVEELNGGEADSIGGMCENVNLNGEQEDFRAKLRSLKVMRAELDEDIRSMERALSIMGSASPPS